LIESDHEIVNILDLAKSFSSWQIKYWIL